MIKYSSDENIRVVLYTADIRLQSLLCAALGRDYEFAFEPLKEKLIQKSSEGAVDVIVVDCGSNAALASQVALIEQFKGAGAPLVVLTDLAAKPAAAALQRMGAFACVCRPPSLADLRTAIERAHESSQLKQTVVAMKQASETGLACDQMVGTSEKAQTVYDLIRRVADLNASVLITGESGTGKELIARAIHNLGSRADRPFVAVSCGAIPETLIESELFGSEKGAFTGATSRVGYLEQAGEGTLFLDEIGELSLHTQVRLLRVLQQREFTRLGSNVPVPLNARIVFATHRDLPSMVAAGTFRKDLFFRVNVIEIKTPALRERTEDIPALARHFVKKYAGEYGKTVATLSSSALDALVAYEWPGNVRELENVIQGAMVLADGNCIGRGDLPAHIQNLDSPVAAAEAEGESFEELIARFKVGLAARAIKECNGNKTLAAKKLGLSRAYLHRLIRVEPDQESVAIAS